jgi:hypothetical protein
MAEQNLPQAPPFPDGANLRWTLRQVEEALRGLRFGALILSVHEGLVIQVERTERQRYRTQMTEG